ncbi:hypothetical protein MRB53_026539 [Persea americana]|uniref:Uncharacterized protein n=1 Tax=Persea americana TaxID=3435 RepID=A0ACC2LIM9_PERAE|nr:hypothetical protein MRB53_026539 [Persea americana]
MMEFKSVNTCILECRFKEKRWDSRRLYGSGGMPSSHSATVTALAVAIGLQEGTGGSSFALAVVLAAIVMYDASGVRLHAGQQAVPPSSLPLLLRHHVPLLPLQLCCLQPQPSPLPLQLCRLQPPPSPSTCQVLNQIVCELPPEHPLSNVRPLRELLGHTPLQVVAGAVLGCIVSYLMRNS